MSVVTQALSDCVNVIANNPFEVVVALFIVGFVYWFIKAVDTATKPIKQKYEKYLSNTSTEKEHINRINFLSEVFGINFVSQDQFTSELNKMKIQVRSTSDREMYRRDIKRIASLVEQDREILSKLKSCDLNNYREIWLYDLSDDSFKQRMKYFFMTIKEEQTLYSISERYTKRFPNEKLEQTVSNQVFERYL